MYDATNINWKRRRTFLNELKNIECFKECVFCVSPVHMCKKRNSTRERQVPDDVIDKMLFNFNIPYYYEGWDKITVHYDYIRPYIDIDEIFNPICGVDYFKQHNPNHTLTLGAHMRKTRDIVEDILYNTYDGFYSSHGTIDILDAATIHDIGKVQTQVFHNFRGDKTDIAHYYNHQYVGAYNSMFVKPSFDYADYSILKRAVMIMWHMQPFFFSGEKNELKWKNLWGEELYNNIMTIHKADTEAK